MDQVYLLSESVNIKLIHSSVETYRDRLTQLIVNDLTRELIEH